MSETVLFHDYATRPVHDRMFGFGVVGGYAPAPEAVTEVAQEQFSEIAYRIRESHWNPSRGSGGFYLAGYDEEGSFAFSGTLGIFVTGFDGTFQLWNGNYFTAAVSVPGQIQAYVQHRAFNSPSLGAAIGIGYRRDMYAFEQPTECSLCVNLDYVDVSSFGVRGFAVYRGEGDTGGGMMLGLHAGYAPLLSRPVFGITLTAGRF